MTEHEEHLCVLQRSRDTLYRNYPSGWWSSKISYKLQITEVWSQSLINWYTKTITLDSFGTPGYSRSTPSYVDPTDNRRCWSRELTEIDTFFEAPQWYHSRIYSIDWFKTNCDRYCDIAKLAACSIKLHFIHRLFETLRLLWHNKCAYLSLFTLPVTGTLWVLMIPGYFSNF